jgi:hypothetical protein
MTAKNHPAFDVETRLALLEKTNEHIYEALIKLDKRFDHLETRLEKRFDKIDQQFEKIDDKFDKIDDKFEKLEAKLDAKIDKLDSKLSSRFFWLLAFTIGGYGSLFTIMAKGFHWF